MLTTVEERIVTLLAETAKLSAGKIRAESRLDELGIDSLVIVEMSFKLRKEFNVPPHIDEELDGVQTVQEIFDLVRRAREAEEGRDPH